jgi:hypothetical protein
MFLGFFPPGEKDRWSQQLCPAEKIPYEVGERKWGEPHGLHHALRRAK